MGTHTYSFTPAGAVGAPPAAAPEVAVQRAAASASFLIPHAASVASGKEATKVTIAVMSLPLELTHRAIPALSDKVPLFEGVGMCRVWDEVPWKE